MINTKWKLATVLGVAGALALSIASAEARPMHHVTHVHRAVTGDAFAYQPRFHNAYGWMNDGVGYDGTGTFSDGRRVPGTNWNPNQN
jgi:hypothetical protein